MLLATSRFDVAARTGQNFSSEEAHRGIVSNDFLTAEALW